MRHTPVDRSHTIAVARSVQDQLDAPTPTVLAAALLHDIGKTEASLGTAGRVIATLLDMALGDKIQRLEGRRGFLGELGRYSTYPEKGAELLRGVNSEPMVVAWAALHHERPDRWTIDPQLGAVLRDADDAAA
jgi:hypothetical protein